MKIKHYSLFNNDYDNLNWSKLRNSENEIQYFLPHTKEKYLSRVERESPTPEIIEIINFCKLNGIKKIVSIGSGVAANEYLIKKFSNIPVIISDYDESIMRLKQFDIFDEVLNVDALSDILPINKETLVIFARIDTEFDDVDLIKLFKKCKLSNVIYIWFIPAELISLRILLAELKIYLISILFKKKRLFCGYARTKKTFIYLWEKYYNIKIEFNSKSFLLIKN